MQVGDCPITNSIFYFRPKKYMFFVPVSPQVKSFQFSHWNVIDHVSIDN